MTALLRWSALVISGWALLAPVRAHAQTYPTSTVQIVVPYPAGGGVDIMARALAAELASLWGKPVIIENVSGANTIVGAQRVARSAPDGQTLMMTLSGTVIGNQFIYKSLSYDPERSFIPISMIAKSGQVILASTKSGFGSFAALRDAAKQAPGTIEFGSPGKGSQEDILLEIISRKEGIKLLSVPYKGVAPTLTALLTGEMQIGVASPGLAAGLIEDGKVKALAIASAQRSPLFPDVPTTAEAGVSYAISTVWYGLFAPAGTPDSIIGKISNDVVSVARKPSFVAKNMTLRGLELVANTPGEFAAEISSERAKMTEIARQIGLIPD